MPQIRPYISQQEAQTNNADTPSSPSDFGGAGLYNIGQGLENLGEGVYRGQAAIKERESRDEVSQAHLDSINAHNEISKDVNTRMNAWKPGDKPLSEIMPDVIKGMYDKQHLDKDGNSKYLTSAGRATWARLAAEGGSHVLDRLIGIDAHLAGEASKQSFADLRNSLSAGVSDDPYSFWMANSQGEKLIRDPNGPYAKLSEVHKDKLVADLKEGNALTVGLALAENDPNGLLSHLKDPRSPLELLDASVRAKLKDKADGNIKALEADARVLEQDKQRKQIELHHDTDRKNMGIFLNPKTRNQVTPTSLSKQAERGELDGPTARAMSNFIETNPSETKKITDDRNYEALWQRVILPFDHPDRFTEVSQIYEAAAKLHLSVPHTKVLINDFHDGRTTAGDGLLKARANHFNAVKQLITKANPLLGKDDPEGNAKLGEYMMFVQTEEAKRIEEKKSPFDLYNPKHPDYIGHKIGPYQKTLKESIGTVVGAINRKPEPPRDPLIADPGSYDPDPSRWGKREDNTTKGTGWFGMLKNQNGQVSSELSTSDPIDASGKPVTHPLLVPTLTRPEIEHLLSGKKLESVDRVIYEKAAAFARKRIAEGKSPYPGPGEQVKLPPQGKASEAAAAGPPKTFRARDPKESPVAYLDAKKAWKAAQ